MTTFAFVSPRTRLRKKSTTCAGAGTGTGGAGSSDFMAVAGAAITPSLFFAFLFNGLVTAARRRVRRAVAIATEKTRTAAETVE